MDVLLLLLFAVADARLSCQKRSAPLELGKWEFDLKHIDSATVENLPVSINEGQVYVYQNNFPGYIIKYIHVDNLAIKSCGASAEIQQGGINESSILIVLHADTNQEIRSVVDIWGEEIPDNIYVMQDQTEMPITLHQFKNIRAVSHNRGNIVAK